MRNDLAAGASISILGARGSIAVHGRMFERYGGASACVLARMGGENILLDAGTGILTAQAVAGDTERFTVLLSHAHMDHMLGLTMFPPLLDRRYQADIFACRRGGLGAQEQIGMLIRPPLWACTADVFHESVHIRDLPDSGFFIGPVRIDWMEGNHPGGCTVYRLTHGGASMVYCTDFEHGEGHTERLVAFAKDCGALIYDAQYSPAEYEKKKGFGHSTWEMGAAVGKRCGAGRVLLFHHAPDRTDEELEREIGRASYRERV